MLAGEGYATATYLPGYAEYAEIPYNANLTNPQTGYFYAAVNLLAGVQYDFDIFSYDYGYRQGATALTPYLDLYDSAGNLLTTTPWTTDGSGSFKGYAGVGFKATTAGTYYIQIAFTGTQTDTYSYFDLRGVATSTGTPPPAPTGAVPIISPLNTSVQASFYKFFTMAQLFTSSDPDAGASITQYEFTVDASAGGGGTFENKGVMQPDGTPFIVTANDLGRINFQATYGADTVSIRAGDGSVVDPHWGAWSSITITAPTDPAPSVTAPSVTLPRATTSEAFASLFTVTDPNGVATTNLNYDISYSGTGGTLELAGVAQPKGSVLRMGDSSSDSNIFAGLSSLTYVPNAAGGTDTITLTVLDGYSAGTTVTFTVTTPSSTVAAPKLTTTSTTLSSSAFFASFSSLFTATDPNGVSLSDLTYTLSYTGTGGTLTVTGSPEARGTNLTFSASQLLALGYTPGLYGGVDQFTLTVSDGLATSAKSTFTITSPSSPGPVFTAVNPPVSVERDQITSALIPTLWTGVDAYPDAAIVQYEFFVANTSTGVGSLLVNGSAVANGVPLVVAAADLDTVSYQGISGSEILYVRANDGTATNPHWGAWASTTVTAPAATISAVFTPNSATVTATRDEVFSTTDVSKPLSLFPVSDASGGTIGQYEFYVNDTGGGVGNLMLNGTVLANDTVDLVSAANLGSLVYNVISGSEVIAIRANDGTLANPIWGAWASVTVTAPAATTGAVFTPNSASLAATRNEVFSTTDASSPLSLFSVSDTTGGAITQYEFYDNDSSGGLGEFLLNGTALTNDTVQFISAGSLSALTFMAIAGTQVISIRANDGTAAHPVWGAWASITITAPTAILTPTSATVTATRDQIYATTDASNPLTLFTLSGVSSSTIVQYEFFDNDTSGGLGDFLLSGQVLANDTVQFIGAGSLDALTYEGIAGSQVISVRANDGTLAHPVWGAWTSVTVTAPAATVGVVFTPTSATITPQRNEIYTTTDASHPLTLFSVADTTGGTIVQYEFYVNDKAGGAGYLLAGTGGLPNDTVELVSAANLDTISYKAIAGTETISIRANDGTAAHPVWGAWSTVTVMVQPTSAPIATAPALPIPTLSTTASVFTLPKVSQSVVSPASLLSSAGQQPSVLLGFTHH